MTDEHDLIFDLQLFADDETDTSDEQGQVQDEEEEESGQQEDTESNTDEEDNNDLTGLDSKRIALDENGNVVFLDDEEDSEDEDEKETSDKSEDETPKRKIKVGDQEVEVTEDELVKGYLRQSDYTKKMQELAKQRQEVERVTKQLPDKPVETQEQTEDFATFNKRITDEAILLAKQRLNLQPDEDLSEVNFEHQSAFQLARREIEQYLDQTSRHHRSITTMEREMRAEEPEFDDVFSYMMDKLENELPKRVSDEITRAYQEADTGKLKEFFGKMRVDYYAKKNGTDTKQQAKPKVPPKVETGGEGRREAPKNKRDASVLRNPKMSFDDKVQKLKEWGLV